MNARSPLVSFIIPLFNHDTFVLACLDSILDFAALVPSELLIIDDGSVDNSAIAVSRWLGEHDQCFTGVVFRSRENRGVSRTLNEMWNLANGEFIAPVASDDYIVTDGFIKRLEHALTNPAVDAVLGDAIIVDAEGNRI